MIVTSGPKGTSVISIPNSAATGLPNGNVTPSAAQITNYLTTQYANKPLSELQSMLQTCSPKDMDYAVISNLISVDQYSQKAISTYSAMPASALAAMIPTMTSKTDQSIATLTLASEYKAQDANLTTSQMQQRFTATGTTDVERAVLISLNPNASPFGSTAVVTPDPPKPSNPKSDPLCSGISLGCLTSSLDAQEAPPVLHTVASVMAGAVGGIALAAIAAPLAPAILTVGITGDVIASTAPAAVLMATAAPTAGIGGGAASALLGTLDSI